MTQLMTLLDARCVLDITEPLSHVVFSKSPGVKFYLDPGWQIGLDSKDGTDQIEGTIQVSKNEYFLTKDALLEACSMAGLPAGFVSRAPAKVLLPALNWFFTESDGKDVKLLTKGDTGLALVRGSLTPFSNLELLDAVQDGVMARNENYAVWVDPQFFHSLRKTYLRLVVQRADEMARELRVGDKWSPGLQIRNSLTGEKPTAIDGYLFRYVCSNGAIDTHATSGKWKRRGSQGDDVYEWARESVDEILGGLEHALDAVQEIADTEISGEVNDFLRDVFTQYKVPAPAREAVIEHMVESEDLTVYGVMQAITASAKTPGLRPEHVERLMQIGGDLPRATAQRCKSCKRIVPE